MNEKIFKEIHRDVNQMLVREAKRNDLMWFYNLHIKEVVEASRKLMELYGGDNHIVTLSAWMHDVSLLSVGSKSKLDEAHRIHHQESYDMTKYFLGPYKIEDNDKIHICNCVLKHRNQGEHCPGTLEEKIIAVADAMSHFDSIYYFTYFKFHPKDNFETMLRMRKDQIEKDWDKLELLPRSKKLVKEKYLFFKELCDNYID